MGHILKRQSATQNIVSDIMESCLKHTGSMTESHARNMMEMTDFC